MKVTILFLLFMGFSDGCIIVPFVFRFTVSSRFSSLWVMMTGIPISEAIREASSLLLIPPVPNVLLTPFTYLKTSSTFLTSFIISFLSLSKPPAVESIIIISASII